MVKKKLKSNVNIKVPRVKEFNYTLVYKTAISWN
jgi:hypothetical protein